MLPLPDLHVALGAYGLPKSGNGHRARAFEVVIQRHDAMVIANAIHAQVANAIDVSDSFGGVQEDDINAYRVSRLADLLRHDDFGAARPHSLDFSRVLMNDDQSLFVVLDVGYASGAGFGGLRGWMNSHGIGRKSP